MIYLVKGDILMNNNFKNFEIFCTNSYIKSGKAKSYANAIKYLCEYLNIDITNEKLGEQIADIEQEITNKNSILYSKFLLFLKKRKQSSYLRNGYVKAAIPQFILFLSKTKANKQPMTKVKAIKEVIKSCNGYATWDDIYSKSITYYPEIMNSIEWKAGIRGVLYRELKNNKTFKRNLDGSFSLIEDISNNKSQHIIDDDDKILLNTLNDNQINIYFDKDKTIGIIPTKEEYDHKYIISSLSGTSINNLHKVYSGRKAEKYFLEFLKINHFGPNEDYFDVANQRTYGFDIKFFNMGLEIKNIKTGSFYLSDNEIAHLENNKTHLILIDIDNGIWLLKNSSEWLNKTIKNIKEIRQYCKSKYTNIDLTDIKINIDKSIEKDVYEVSQLTHDEIYNIIIDNKI